MKKLYVSALAVFFVALATVVLAAQPDGRPAPGGPAGFHAPGHPHHEFGSFLNLSKEQMDKMFQVTTKYQDEVRQTRYDLFQKRLNARKLFTDPKADNATILAKEKEISALQQKIHDRMVQMRLEQRNILTPEQLQKLNEAPMGFGPRGREGSRS